MPKKKGILLKKEVTKSGNMKLVFQTKKGEESVYVLKRNKNLLATTQQLAVGDKVGVSLRRYLGKMYCTRLAKAQDTRKEKEFFVAEEKSESLGHWINS